MTILRCSCMTALAVVPFLVAAADAQVAVRAPLTQVEVGPDQVKVQAPFVRIQVPLTPQPAPPLIVRPQVIVPAPPAGVAPLTPAEFATTFRPLPGYYEVVLQHPFTLQPVKVIFTLPNTTGHYRTHVRPRSIEFDSPDRAVEILFLRNGRVVVEKY